MDRAVSGLRRVGRARRRALLAAFAAVITLAPVGILGAVVGPVAAADEAPLTVVAKMPLNDPTGAEAGNVAMVDAGARRLLYWGTATPDVRAYDLDTFRQVASVSRSAAEIPSFPWSLDPSRHVLFHLGDNKAVLRGLDTRTLQTVVTAALPQDYTDGGSALLWSQRDHLVYVIHNADQTVEVNAIDPWSGSSGTIKWTSYLQGCNLTASNNNPAALGESSDGQYLYSVCYLPGGTRASAGVVRLQLPPANAQLLPGNIWRGTVDIYPGLVTGGLGNSLWVPGSDRMVTLVSSNGERGWSAYVFDTKTLHYVFAPGLYNPPSDGNVWYASAPAFAVDPQSGRMLAQSSALTETPGAGGLCKYATPGTNSLALAETSIAGASVLHLPVPDGTLNGEGRIGGYDPVRHDWLLFSDHVPAVSSCNPFGVPDAAYIVVLHDNVPGASTPPVSNPDAGTTNVAEQPGVTAFNASSDASAYGVRYALGPSGAEGVMTNGTVLATGTCNLDSYVAQTGATMGFPLALQAPPLPPQYHAFCNSDGRTATFAHVDKVTLDGSEARATSITADTDNETGRDLSGGTDYSAPGTYSDSVTGFVNTANPAGGPPAPTPCPSAAPAPGQPAPLAPGLPTPTSAGTTTCDQALNPAQPYLSGLALPYRPASCGDNGSEAKNNSAPAPLQLHGLPPNDPSTNPLTYPGSASVRCSFIGQVASGHADQSSASVGGPLAEPASAMTATADAAVARTVSDGSTATATSTVKNISIGSFLHIASLTVSASAAAHGRPHTNPTDYSCTVTGVAVTLPTNVSLPPGVPTSIPSANCSDANVTALTDALNRILVGVVHIAFPAAPTIQNGPPGGMAGAVQRQSPGGYLSEVALSDLDQIQNGILTNDTSIEQPGLVVTYYLDNAYSRNHLVASFAGVAASARYGIFLLDNPSSGTPSELGSGPDAGALGALPGTSGSGSSPLPVVATGGGGGSSQSPGGGGFSPLRVAQAIVDGFRFLFQHPELIPPVLAVWLLFVGPGYLLSRRRALLVATEGGA